MKPFLASPNETLEAASQNLKLKKWLPSKETQTVQTQKKCRGAKNPSFFARGNCRFPPLPRIEVWLGFVHMKTQQIEGVVMASKPTKNGFLQQNAQHRHVFEVYVSIKFHSSTSEARDSLRASSCQNQRSYTVFSISCWNCSVASSWSLEGSMGQFMDTPSWSSLWQEICFRA